MAFNGVPAYALTPAGILTGAPETSGIYAIFTPTQWVFIAEADNMRQALFRLVDAPPECIESHHPLSFSCEDAPWPERHALVDALIEALRPKCNCSRGDPR